MPIGDEDHGRVAMAVPIVPRGVDQPPNFVFRQMLTAAQFSIGPTGWTNCSFYDGRRNQISDAIFS